MHTTPPRPVAIPADLEVEERLAGPFTARQCAILAVTAAAALAEGEALHTAHLTSALMPIGDRLACCSCPVKSGMS